MPGESLLRLAELIFGRTINVKHEQRDRLLRAIPALVTEGMHGWRPARTLLVDASFVQAGLLCARDEAWPHKERDEVGPTGRLTQRDRIACRREPRDHDLGRRRRRPAHLLLPPCRFDL